MSVTPVSSPVQQASEAKKTGWRSAPNLAVAINLLLVVVVYLITYFVTAGRVDTTFLWAPERILQDRYFKLNPDTQILSAPPVTWIRADPPSWNQTPIPTNVSIVWIRKTLELVKSRNASVVVLDVDIAFSSGTKIERAALKTVLQDWAASSTTTLLIAREAFLNPQSRDKSYILPETDYDEIVNRAKNISWASSELCSDNNGIVRSMPAAIKVQTVKGNKITLLSIPDLVARAVLGATEEIQAFDGAGCDPKRNSFPKAGSHLIHWHLGPSQSPSGVIIERQGIGSWKMPAECETKNLRSLSIFGTNSDETSKPVLCGRVVILGASDQITRDRSQTPIGDLEGPINLANAIRSSFPQSGTITTASPHSFRSIVLQFFLAIVAAIAASRLDSERALDWMAKRKICCPKCVLLLAEFLALIISWVMVDWLIPISMSLNVVGCFAAAAWSFVLTRWIVRFTKPTPQITLELRV